jgi:purine nucleosidase
LALPIIIDTDPGIDDAVALLLAFASPEFDIKGVTVVSGNVALEHTVRNTLQVCELAGRRDVPVYAGCTRPLLRNPIYGLFSGQGGLGKTELPAPTMKVQETHAVDYLVAALADAARACKRVTVCTLGPLTNLAVALAHTPQIKDGIERIVMMAGAFRELGNRSISAEFNILVDPHAAHIVFEAGIPITMLPLDVTHQAMATPARIDVIRSVGNSVTEIVADILTFWDRKDSKRFGGRGGPLHDPLVFDYLLAPDHYGSEEARVWVEHTSELVMGHTVADFWGKTGEKPNVQVVLKVDADAFFALLGTRLAAYAKG